MQLFYVLLVISAVSLSEIKAECCPKQKIQFTLPGKNGGDCHKYSDGHSPYPTITAHAAVSTGFDGKCQAEVCGDGLHHSSGCGNGPCNPANCDCQGGCIPGDPIDNFKKLYGSSVSNVVAFYTMFDVLSLFSGSVKRHHKCCVTLYEKPDFSGEYFETCDTECEDVCIELPKEWKKRATSLKGLQKVSFYPEPKCKGEERKAKYHSNWNQNCSAHFLEQLNPFSPCPDIGTGIKNAESIIIHDSW